MHIDLRQLRHFIALVEHRNFTLAAQAMNISQSAFSRSIQSLEQGLGDRLVDRNHNLEPTQKGLIVLEYARRLNSNMQDLLNEVRHFSDKETGELRFACGPAPAAWLLPRVIGHFSRQFPKARLHFRVDNWQALGQRLMAEEFEFIVADSRNFEFNADYNVRPLSQNRWGFCCRKGHPLADLTDITVEQLFSYPLAATVRPPNLHRALTQLSGRQDIRTSIECENGYSLLEIVRHSDAIGTTHISSYNPTLQQGDIKLLKIQGLDDDMEEFYTHYGIVTRTGSRLSWLAHKLIDAFLFVDQELKTREAEKRHPVQNAKEG